MIKIISRLKSSYRLIKYGLNAPKVKLETVYQSYAAKRMGLVNSSSLDLGCGNIPRNPFGADVMYGVDLFEQPNQNIKVADLAINPIPFADNSFDYITAFDFVEHIPRILYAPTRSFPFVNLMNEVFRCLKPGGYFLACLFDGKLLHDKFKNNKEKSLNKNPLIEEYYTTESGEKELLFNIKPLYDINEKNINKNGLGISYFLSHTPAYPYSPLFRDPTHVNYITEETFSIYFDTENTYAKIYGFNGGFKIACEGWSGFTLVSFLQKPVT